MNKHLGKKIIAKGNMYIRVAADAPNFIEFYSPFFIDGSEIIGALKGDVFEIIEENEKGVTLIKLSNEKQNKIWIDNQRLWMFSFP